jgi:5-methylthioribose kinase
MLDIQEHNSIEILKKLPYWKTNESIISALPAGESNMNLVLRVKTNLRSFILKQSKNYVRKFPQIPAPITRIEVEHAFYDLVQNEKALSDFSPKVIHFDSENYILLTEDLGEGSDFLELYSGKKQLSLDQIGQLANYLNALHEIQTDSFPSNLEMKKLNHEHIFNFPFEENNGFDLNSIQAGLQEISLPFKRNQSLKDALKKLGTRYLATGKTLIHGDFYPASWLEINGKLKIIDPEFGFKGDAEFDLGVLFAHLQLSKQPQNLKEEFLNIYKKDFEQKLVDQYESVEIMRRLIGIAQLPVDLTIDAKKKLLEDATNLLTHS